MQGSELIEIMAPALVAGLIVALLHAPLGLEVLARGIVFIDLAIAQIAGLFVVLVNYWIHEPSWGVVQLAAGLSAICAAFIFRWIERILPREQEAIIGSTFILAASAMLLVLVDRPHGGEEMRHILAGQILFVRWPTIFSFAPVFLAALFLWFRFPSLQRGLPFFLIFAVVVTASVQLVGVYVVFASLILPALAVNTVRARKTVAAIAVSIIAVLIGITASTLADLPAGPTLVFAYAMTTFIVRLSVWCFRFPKPRQEKPHQDM